MPKKKITVIKKDKRVRIGLSLTDIQKEKLQKMADKYAEGNLSQWIIYAGINHKPKLK